jgi:hypothetical protein
MSFPASIATAELYPTLTVNVVVPGGEGEEVAVPCFVPGGGNEVTKVACPAPFVNALEENSLETCIKPCPVPVYSDGEYTSMWLAASIVGMFGWLLNIFVFLTWMLGGRLVWKKLPFQIRYSVLAGVVYGIVETLPSLVLKYDLPCACETEECTGQSTMCAINRAGIYILLSIMMQIATLSFLLFSSMHDHRGQYSLKTKAGMNTVATGIPFALMLVAYSVENEDADSELRNLHLARHAFSCSMRFPDMQTEWKLLWWPFLLCGVLIVGFCLGSWWRIGTLQKMAGLLPTEQALVASRRMAQRRRRLFQLVEMICFTLLLNVGATLFTSSVLDKWASTADLSLTCVLLENYVTRDWGAYGLDSDIQNVCSQEESTAPAIEQSCSSDCYWYPELTTAYLTCEISGFPTLEEQAKEYFSTPQVCDCPCSSLVTVKRPSAFVTTISYVAQSMVVAIVGINTGFRREFFAVWVRFAQSRTRFSDGEGTLAGPSLNSAVVSHVRSQSNCLPGPPAPSLSSVLPVSEPEAS